MIDAQAVPARTLESSILEQEQQSENLLARNLTKFRRLRANLLE
jgi:hypothetical protein